MNIKKFYFKVPAGCVKSVKGESDSCTHIEVSLGYEKGGYSFLVGEHSDRGYYMYVRPVRVDGMFTSFTLFHGCKNLIVPCGRQCKGKEAEAKRIFDAEAESFAKKVYPSGVDYTQKEIV